MFGTYEQEVQLAVQRFHQASLTHKNTYKNFNALERTAVLGITGYV